MKGFKAASPEAKRFRVRFHVGTFEMLYAYLAEGLFSTVFRDSGIIQDSTLLSNSPVVLVACTTYDICHSTCEDCPMCQYPLSSTRTSWVLRSLWSTEYWSTEYKYHSSLYASYGSISSSSSPYSRCHMTPSSAQ